MSQTAAGSARQRDIASPSWTRPIGKATDPGSLNRIRCRRGRTLFRARRAQIRHVAEHEYRVPSQNDGGLYNVCLKPGAEHCSCPDFARYGRRADVEPGDFACKHMFAALLTRIKSAAAPDAAEIASRVEAA